MLTFVLTQDPRWNEPSELPQPAPRTSPQPTSESSFKVFLSETPEDKQLLLQSFLHSCRAVKSQQRDLRM